MGISTFVVHPRDSAACSWATADAWIAGPYTATPKLTTGAGDTFNAGFILGQLLDLPAEECLTLGTSTSDYYVRTGQSPEFGSIGDFLQWWTANMPHNLG